MQERFKGWIESGSEEDRLVGLLDFAKIPNHVAVIMDGNGRWAAKRNLPRTEGHRAGAESVQEVIEAAARLGVRYLTLYAFSKENWKRPKNEVSTLWRLMENYLRKESHVLVENQFRLKAVGQLDGLPARVRNELERVENRTKDFDRLTVVIALNYGGRAEIVDAVNRLLAEKQPGRNVLTEEEFSRYLYTSGIPDPDLLIRTSGEMRVSNFLLWQIAYAEIWVTSDYWPDFRKKHFLQALIDYQKRERRFGDIHPR